jgi:4-amino-4-deoxy-L-arabinose transferase-like glycosyltransferase
MGLRDRLVIRSPIPLSCSLPLALFSCRRITLSGFAKASGLIAPLSLAALLRLGWPGVNLFDFDQARVSLLALQMARQGEFVRIGMPSSQSVLNFPATVWIFALPYRLSTDPLVASLFVGVLGTLAVAGVWWLAFRAWGAWPAFVAALLFAASPYAVFYSRDIWSQDLLLPLAVLWAISGVAGVSRGPAWAVALHVFLAGFAFQVHYAGVALVPATLWLVVRYRLWPQWRAMLIGGVFAVLCAAPFVYTVWCCAPSVRGDLQKALQQPAQVDLRASQFLAFMGSGHGWEGLLLGPAWKWGGALAGSLVAGSLAAGTLMGLGFLALVWQMWQDVRRDPHRCDARGVLTALTPVWALSAPLVFLVHKTQIYQQYLLPALPALFLMAGSMAALARAWRWRVVVGAAVLVIAAPQVVAYAQGMRVMGQRATPGGIHTPLLWPRAAARALMDGRRIVVHAYGDQPEFYGEVGAFDVLLWNYPHQVVDGQSVLLIPPAGQSAHLLAVSPELPMWPEAQAVGLGGNARQLPRRAGEPPYLVLDGNALNLESFEPVGPLTLGSGAQLRGWRVRPVGDRLRLTTWWTIVGPIAPGEFHQFNHLRGAQQSADEVSVHDVPISSQAWRVGDTLITWADFEQPTQAGPFVADVGMYTWPELERSPVLDHPGDPLAPITLGPFDWPGG